MNAPTRAGRKRQETAALQAASRAPARWRHASAFGVRREISIHDRLCVATPTRNRFRVYFIRSKDFCRISQSARPLCLARIARLISASFAFLVGRLTL